MSNDVKAGWMALGLDGVSIKDGNPHVGAALRYTVSDITDEALTLEEPGGDVIVIGWGLINAIRRGLTAREDVKAGTILYAPPEERRHHLDKYRRCHGCGLEPPEVYNTACEGKP